MKYGYPLTEGMVAIRRLTWDTSTDNTRIISDIADAMHNGFDSIDQLSIAVAKAGLQKLERENPELKSWMPHSFAWASNKGADG